ncbi:MAG TPA: enoyl-CoA hydratase-related protein [Ktedonobacterales bacterium]|nr:enoyl-CoA hydratase-related protein [Ktedonobacterales bacterium]
MESYETLLFETAGPVVTITLNRPDVRNAMSNHMVEELLTCFTELASEVYADIRAVVLRAAGDVFCAGGDIRDLSAGGAPGESDAVARLDKLLRAVNEAPQVVIARIQGPVMGGGLGLVCVSDIAIAATRATFALPEVRLGIVPALISPFVVARVGLMRARQIMLTGARFDAAAALAYGLVHETCPDAELDARIDAALADVLTCAPQALRACKRLLFTVASESDTLAYRVDLLNRLRASDEAQQGMRAFLTKQPAPWIPRS